MNRSFGRGLLIFSALLASCASGRPRAPEHPTVATRCQPREPCWPTPADWQGLRATLTGKLEEPQNPLGPCTVDPAAPACKHALSDLKNPFYLQDQAGGTQSLGWLGAWTAAPSAYAVAAANANDIVAAVKFARKHRLKLVIKGTGHDYLGRSNAPDSLLVWTHEMRDISMHETFRPRGCESSRTPTPAVSVAAGARWSEAYDEVTVKHHRYVQGGGCTSVGVAGGFLQGGGFGSWSKKYGTAAAGLLEAEVVTADGEVLVANACQNSDLFWALRGGGGGTFGVVTKVTLMTHPLPSYFGFVIGNITAATDAAFRELLEQFLSFYRQSLNNEFWGEQIRVNGNNSLRLSMSFQGLSAKEAESVWQPLRAFVEQRPEKFVMKADYLAVPGDRMWDAGFIKGKFGDVIQQDGRPGQKGNLFWWSADGGQVAAYWYTYQSRWIPLDRFEGDESKKFAKVLFEASRHWALELHFNKGQAGAAAEAVQRGRETSVNPAVYNAAALVIAAATGEGYPGVRGREPNVAEGEAERAKVNAAMKLIRAATPGAGSYVNETDYFEPDWQREFWGDHYARLLEIKHKYDPEGVFTCHHCVGSESDSAK